ncbi:MAG: S10 family peptidase [Erythrobacter sp.]
MVEAIARRGFFALIGAVLVWVALGTAPAPALARDLPDYKAAAAMMPIGKDPERPEAEIFHIAYTLKGADPATRPVTFVFNGGPGGASIYLHMSAIGPMTVATAGDGSFPSSPAKLAPNPESWIHFTDLVFIDPVGTGYSRTLPGPDGAPRDPSPYYTVAGDLDSIALFIRQWLTKHQRWGSPKAIAGESYGGQRVAALSKLLADQYAINLNRAILISPALNVELTDTRYSVIKPMTLIPTEAAIAAFHGLNAVGSGPEAMKRVEDYAIGEYSQGLERLGRMTPEQQQAFYVKVASTIGIEPGLVARHRGKISETVYVASLLASKGQVLDRYDGTQMSDNPVPESEEMEVLDRSLTVLSGVLLPPFMDYVAKDLGYVTERPYIPLNLEVNMAWDRASPLGSPDDLAVALAQNQDLKVLVLHGYHDLVTNYFLTRYVLEQSVLGPDARKRLFFGNYDGGHMFYLRSASRTEFTKDVRGFFEGSENGLVSSAVPKAGQ